MEQNQLVLGMVIIIMLIIFVPMLILMIVGAYKVYEKAGEEGWKCIIPFYNIIIMLKIVGKPWWWIFLMFIPYIGVIWHVWILNMLSKSFGKDEGFTVGLVFLPFIFYMILGLNKDKYLGPYGDPEAFNAHRQDKGFDFERNVFNP